jgi:uncharacterized protein YggL (DUF469 family)
MRKRLRKKRCLGEFREHAFDVSYALRPGLSVEQAEDFLFRFLEQAIEANDLACGGGGQGESWELCVTRAGRGSPTEEQRDAVSAWLASQPEVRSHNLGAFFDAWHEPEESPPSGPPAP